MPRGIVKTGLGQRTRGAPGRAGCRAPRWRTDKNGPLKRYHVDAATLRSCSSRSALLRRLGHEAGKLWRHLRPLAPGTLRRDLLAFRDRHAKLEGLLTVFAEKLVLRHTRSLFLPDLPQDGFGLSDPGPAAGFRPRTNAKARRPVAPIAPTAS